MLRTRNYIVTLRHLARGDKVLTVRATDSGDAIIKAELLCEGTGWFPLYAGAR